MSLPQCNDDLIQFLSWCDDFFLLAVSEHCLALNKRYTLNRGLRNSIFENFTRFTYWDLVFFLKVGFGTCFQKFFSESGLWDLFSKVFFLKVGFGTCFQKLVTALSKEKRCVNSKGGQGPQVMHTYLILSRVQWTAESRNDTCKKKMVYEYISMTFCYFYKGKQLLWLSVCFISWHSPPKMGFTVKILNIGTCMSEQTV